MLRRPSAEERAENSVDDGVGAYITEIIEGTKAEETELQPGDIISTGTPGGVGFARKPPVWLKPGEGRDVLDQFRSTKFQITDRRCLHHFTVEAGFEVQCAGVRNFVGGNHPRPHAS